MTGSPGPDARVLTRAVGATVACSGAVLALAWFVVPLTVPSGAGPSPTLAQASQGSFEDTGVALQCVVAVVLGLAGALRPAVGPGVVAMAAIPLPWVLRFNLLGLGSDPPAVLVLLTSSSTALAAAVTVAVVVAVRSVIRLGVRPTPSQAVAWAIGAAALTGTAGLGWYRLRVVDGVTIAAGHTVDTDPDGAVLGVGSWPGRGSCVGLALAVLALGLAVVSTGPIRRAGGWVLVTVLVAEAVRRAVLPAQDLSRFDIPDVATVEIVPLGVLVPLLGAGVGAWLALGPVGGDDGGEGTRADQVEGTTLPSRAPVDGPPTAWSEPPGG